MNQKLYLKVESYITDKIKSEIYRTGDQIPTETELAKELNVSRPTVRQALARLTADGQLVRIKGRGTFVTQPKILHESTTFISGYRAESQKKHRTIRTKVLNLSVVSPDEVVAASLQLSTSDKVIKLTRLRSIDHYNNNLPVVYTTVHVPFHLFPQMTDIDFTNISFYDALDAKGLSVCHASRKLEAIITPSSIAAALRISTFEPSLFVTSIGTTQNLIPVEYSESYYPAGCSRFLIEINR